MSPTTASSLRMGIAAAALVAAIIGFVLALQDIGSARANADAARSQLAIVSDKARAIGQEARLAAETKTDRGRLTELVIPSGGDANYISTLENLAAAAHVSIAISSVTATAPSADAPGNLLLALQIKGSWAGCMRYLQLVETEPLAQAIPNISFTYDAAGKQWQGAMSLSALSFDAP